MLLQVDADAAEQHAIATDVRLVGRCRRVDRHERHVVAARDQLTRERVVAGTAAAEHPRSACGDLEDLHKFAKAPYILPPPMGLAEAITGTLAIAAVSTAGDFIWATWIAEARGVYGFIHGALLFLAIGLFLGRLAGRAAAGAIAGACVGALAAGLYYVLAPTLGLPAMIVAWMAVWLGLAFVYGSLSAQRTDVGNRHDIRVNLNAVAS